MALKIRLARGGAKNKPYYRINVADSRMPRDGRFIERIGSYNPMLPSDHEERIVIKEDRVKFWMAKGARPTDRVAVLLGRLGIIDMPEPRAMTKKNQMKAKAQQRAEEKAEKEREAAEAAAAASAEPDAATEDANAEDTSADEAAAESGADAAAAEE